MHSLDSIYHCCTKPEWTPHFNFKYTLYSIQEEDIEAQKRKRQRQKDKSDNKRQRENDMIQNGYLDVERSAG